MDWYADGSKANNVTERVCKTQDGRLVGQTAIRVVLECK